MPHGGPTARDVRRSAIGAVVDTGRWLVAIAPVTDFAALKESHRRWSDFNLISKYVGDGPHIREGSPAQNADKIKAPVLMF